MVDQLTDEVAVDIFKRMARIRTSDDRFLRLLSAGAIEILGYYSARGQECIPAAISAHLRSDDYLCTTYRGLHDMIAKGMPLDVLWAECLGKASGMCKGKGGPMHLTYPALGIMVSSGIVGGGIPIANGLALASQLDGNDRVTVVNFGDGATNIGAFHEALNLAGVWKLPVVFVCQNNQYGEHSRIEKTTPIERLSARAASYGMPGVTVDGNDPLSVWESAGEAIARARRGDGPTLIEATTFRFCGHAFGDVGSPYMREGELAEAIAADPYPRYRSWLAATGKATTEALDAFEQSIEEEVSKAVEFAMSSPDPDLGELDRDTYAEEGGQWPLVVA